MKIKVENNMVSAVYSTKDKKDAFDWEGAIGCYYIEGNDLVIRNNTAASCWRAGFDFPARNCPTESEQDAGITTPEVGNIFEDNIAHSIKGWGWIPSSGSGSCQEVSRFKGYKTAKSVVLSISPLGGNIHVHSNIVIEGSPGISPLGPSGAHIQIYNNTIYGSENMKNKDCPDAGDCFCKSNFGVYAPTFGNMGGSRFSVGKKISKGMSIAGGMGTGKATFFENTFIGFSSPSNECGSSQRSIKNNGLVADMHSYSFFNDNTFVNQERKALINLASPPRGWANMKDCWTFTCTGLYQHILKFDNNRFTGSPLPFNLPKTFQAVANNKESVSDKAIPTC